MKRAIITTYCVAVFLTVLIVPWKSASRQVGNMQLGTQSCGYSFLFSPPSYCYNGTIEYGFVLLEIIAISAVAAIFFIFQDHLVRMAEVWQNPSKQPIWKKRIVTVNWLFRLIWRFYLLFWVLSMGLAMAVLFLYGKYGDNIIFDVASIILVGIVFIVVSVFMLNRIAFVPFYFLDRKDDLKEDEQWFRILSTKVVT